MNERIKQLAVEAGMILGDASEFDMAKFMPKEVKFAELIIAECATELLKWKDEPFPFDEDLAVRLIKDHFGVKE